MPIQRYVLSSLRTLGTTTFHIRSVPQVSICHVRTFHNIPRDHAEQKYLLTRSHAAGLRSSGLSHHRGLHKAVARYCNLATHFEFASTAGMTSTNPEQYRLPTNVKPAHYDLTIRTDLEKLTFDGFVRISLQVKEDTKQFVLNSSELDLGVASIYSDALKIEQTQIGHSFDSAQERLTLEFQQVIPAGSKAELRVPFSGKLTGSLAGYYKSAWEENGQTKHYALTQFEPTTARRAFPCWDEPALKATFALTLISRFDTVNLGNMPSIEEGFVGQHGSIAYPDLAKLYTVSSEGEQWKYTKFETTPIMSSYIVAWANGPFKSLKTTVELPISKKTIPLQIYATADNIHQAQWALDVKAKVLPLYEQVFDVHYPLPKLDTLVASDFDAGAMENWGLITGRTSVYLLDPERPDVATKKLVASVQSHEVAHMWFGNITTMEWWNYLYLNEGFATLMGEVIIAAFPEWKANSEFISSHLNRALSLDAKLSSHPIEVDCPDANRIGQIFDSLSYSKAASVLRMLSNYVGEDRFLKGVSIYLKGKMFANSVTNDLWEGITKSTGIDIIKFMDNWISKMGFPVLTVTENEHGIQIRQDRFLETGLAEPKDNETIWNVPLYILSVGQDGKSVVDKAAVLQEREKTFAVDTSRPFKLNGGTAGVYRVLYTPERLAKIGAEAAKDNSAFSVDDRLGLVHDALALAQAGLSQLSSALTLINILRNEKEYLVWSGIAETLAELTSIWWEHPEVTAEINAFRRHLFFPIVNRLGYEYHESESNDIHQLRTLAISHASAAGDEKVVNELKARFAHLLKTGDDSKIPADLQRATYTTAVRFGGRAEYDAIVQIHDKPKTPSARIAAIGAMCATEDAELGKETLNFITNKSRSQDFLSFFRAAAHNPKMRRPLVQYFKTEYDALVKRFDGNFSFTGLVKSSFTSLSSQQDYDDVVKFFEDKDKSKYDMVLAQCLDSIKAKTAYIGRSTEDLKRWLEKWAREQK